MRAAEDWLRKPRPRGTRAGDEEGGNGFLQFSLYNGLPVAGLGGRGVVACGGGSGCSASCAS